MDKYINTPLLAFRTGYMSPRDVPIFSKQDQKRKYCVDVVCVKHILEEKNSYSIDIKVFTEHGGVVYHNIIGLFEDDKFQNDLELVKKELDLYLNNYFFGGYEKALLIFDGEKPTDEETVKILTDWGAETGNLLYSSENNV